MNRRTFLATLALGTAGAALMTRLPGTGDGQALAKWNPLARDGSFGNVSVPETVAKLELSPEEWKAKLTPMQFSVLREEATERPYTSPLNDEKRTGTYHCAGCDLPLYRSETKFDSRTGWPSFYQSVENAVGTKTDYYLIYPRTEVHCIRCGGHQGHIFDDGPKPTGNRHCINGVALTFKPDAAAQG